MCIVWLAGNSSVCLWERKCVWERETLAYLYWKSNHSLDTRCNIHTHIHTETEWPPDTRPCQVLIELYIESGEEPYETCCWQTQRQSAGYCLQVTGSKVRGHIWSGSKSSLDLHDLHERAMSSKSGKPRPPPGSKPGRISCCQLGVCHRRGLVILIHGSKTGYWYM